MRLTREKVIEMFGSDVVKRLDNDECLPTNRLMPEGEKHLVEFSASQDTKDNEGFTRTVTAFYYQTLSDVNNVEDYSDLIWEIDSYEVD